MKNLFVVAELLYNKITAILVEKIEGKIIVHGLEEEELEDNVFDVDGVLNNYSIVSAKLCQIAQKMENRAVKLFDNKPVRLTHIDLSFSCFPLCAYEDSASFNLNYNQTIDRNLIEAYKRSYNLENTEDKVVSWFNDLEYYVDGVECADPNGEQGNVLNINYLALSCSKLMFDNFEKAKDRFSFDVDFSISPVLEPSVFLINEVDSAFAIVAIKRNYSYVEIYNKSKMRHLSVIPFGWNDVFNDLKHVLTSKENGTPLKESTLTDSFFYSLVSNIFSADKKSAIKIGAVMKFEAQKLYDIVASRFNEIFTLAKYQIDKVSETFDGAVSIGIISDIEKSGVCSLAKEFFKTDCIVLAMRNDFFESDNSLPSDPSTLLGLAMRVGTPSFEVVEDDEKKIDETPYVKKPEKGKKSIFNSLRKFEGLFAGENGENNER